jgi:nucleoside-diphosphate-sugar epimerase
MNFVSDGEKSNSYGYKKRKCEEELINSDTGEMLWTVVRPCHIYGPTSLLGCLPLHGRDADLITKMKNRETLQLVGGGHHLQQPILADDLAETIISIGGKDNIHEKIFNTAGPDIIESVQYYEIIADILGAELKVEEIAVDKYLEENPGMNSFICHRIYDLTPLKEAGLSVPSTSIEAGLKMHVEGLL